MPTYLVSCGNGIYQEKTVPGFTEWYRILREHHHWSIFQSIRYAFWLSRNTQLLETVKQETEDFWREMAGMFDDAFGE